MDRSHMLALCAGVGLAVFMLGAMFSQALRRARERQIGRAANARGQRGERAAELLLKRHGYATLARQVRRQYSVQLGDLKHDVALQADFLVERDGRQLVAEVKTGRNAPRFELADTRRQLLEYQLAFQVDSVLLIDVEAGLLHEVRFPLALTGRRSWPLARLAWLSCAVAAGWIYWLARG